MFRGWNRRGVYVHAMGTWWQLEVTVGRWRVGTRHLLEIVHIRRCKVLPFILEARRLGYVSIWIGTFVKLLRVLGFDELWWFAVFPQDPIAPRHCLGTGTIASQRLDGQAAVQVFLTTSIFGFIARLLPLVLQMDFAVFSQ